MSSIPDIKEHDHFSPQGKLTFPDSYESQTGD